MSRGRLRNLVLAATDLLVLVAVWAFSVWAYRAIGIGHYKHGAEFYWRLWPVSVSYLVANVLFRLYHGNLVYPAAPVNPVEELRRLCGSSVLVHLGLIAYLGLAYQTTENYSRAVILIAGILTAFVSQPARNLVRQLIHRFDALRIPVVLAGSGELADRIARTLAADAYFGFKVVLRVEEDFHSLVPEARRLGVKVLVACQDPRLFRCQMSECAEWFSHIEYVPSGESFPVMGAQPVSFDGAGGLEMVNQRTMKGLRLEKWLMDKALALLAFVLLSPFFVLIPLLIKVTSRGPVFYRQTRLGRKGRTIRVWKFRSMYVDADERLDAILASDPARKAEWEANFKLANDPRVTPLGKFLRKTSIDEFPQLFNVFAGDMALVGPRPIVAKEAAYYGAAFETFSSVEPGITGLWQASGRSDTDYARRVALDTYYVLNWSPWMDIWILFRTVGAVFFMRGAR